LKNSESEQNQTGSFPSTCATQGVGYNEAVIAPPSVNLRRLFLVLKQDIFIATVRT